MPAHLVGLRGLLSGQRVPVATATVSFGRTPDNTVCLETKSVSRKHAELRRDGTTYAIVDLGSANGTLVNGERVQSRYLQHGDTIQMGEEAFRFEVTDDAPANAGVEAELIAVHGPHKGRRWPVGPVPVWFGRVPENTIIVESVQASRRHAELVKDAAGYLIADRGSFNGTYVNRERISSRYLQHGDVVQIGEEAFRFEVRGAANLESTAQLGDPQARGNLPPLPPFNPNPSGAGSTGSMPPLPPFNPAVGSPQSSMGGGGGMPPLPPFNPVGGGGGGGGGSMPPLPPFNPEPTAPSTFNPPVGNSPPPLRPSSPQFQAFPPPASPMRAPSSPNLPAAPSSFDSGSNPAAGGPKLPPRIAGPPRLNVPSPASTPSPGVSAPVLEGIMEERNRQNIVPLLPTHDLTIRCPTCKRDIEVTHRTCPHDGTPLPHKR